MRGSENISINEPVPWFSHEGRRFSGNGVFTSPYRNGVFPAVSLQCLPFGRFHGNPTFITLMISLVLLTLVAGVFSYFGELLVVYRGGRGLHRDLEVSRRGDFQGDLRTIFFHQSVAPIRYR